MRENMQFESEPRGRQEREPGALLTNSFSLGMLGEYPASIKVEEVSLLEAREMGRFCRSIVGHADTAAVFAEQLGYPVPFNRESVKLMRGDRLIVGQYIGPRLPEGVTALPAGATIKWLWVSVGA